LFYRQICQKEEEREKERKLGYIIANPSLSLYFSSPFSFSLFFLRNVGYFNPDLFEKRQRSYNHTG